MSPRPRRAKTRDLPANLYPNGKAYRYKHPATGVFHGMGTNRREAIRAANILNQRLTPESDIVTKIMGGTTISELVQRFRDEYIAHKDWAGRTLEETEYRLARYDRELGEMTVSGLTLERLTGWLRPLTTEAYRKHRNQWIEIFRFARSVGIVETNIAEITLTRDPAKKQRQRWTVSQFEATRKIAEHWLQIAIDLALVTLLRREDLVNLRYDMIRGEHLYITTSKQVGEDPHNLAIRIGPKLKAIIERSKKRDIACPYIIARKPTKNNASEHKSHPFQVLPSYLTKAVSKARDETKLFDDYKAGERPSLHEFRSFGAYLYRCALVPEEQIQALLAHEDPKMTAHYLAGYGKEWLEVGQGLT